MVVPPIDAVYVRVHREICRARLFCRGSPVKHQGVDESRVHALTTLDWARDPDRSAFLVKLNFRLFQRSQLRHWGTARQVALDQARLRT